MLVISQKKAAKLAAVVPVPVNEEPRRAGKSMRIFLAMSLLQRDLAASQYCGN